MPLILLFSSCNQQPKHEENKTSGLPTVENVGIKPGMKIEYEVSNKKVEFVLGLFDQMIKQRALEAQNPYAYSQLGGIVDQKDYANTNADQHITYDTLKYQKIDKIITLPLLGGKTLTLEDNPVESYEDAMATYKYVGSVEKLDKFLVEAYFWEGYACLVIDQKDGSIETLPSIPRFNEGLTKMATYESDPYEEQTKLFIYDIVSKQFKLSYTESWNALIDMTLYWKGNNFLTMLYPYGQLTDSKVIEIFNKEDHCRLSPEWRGKYNLHLTSEDIDGDQYYNNYNLTIGESSTYIEDTSDDYGVHCNAEYWAYQDSNQTVTLYFLKSDEDCHANSYKLKRKEGDIYIQLYKDDSWQRLTKVEEFEEMEEES